MIIFPFLMLIMMTAGIGWATNLCWSILILLISRRMSSVFLLVDLVHSRMSIAVMLGKRIHSNFPANMLLRGKDS